MSTDKLNVLFLAANPDKANPVRFDEEWRAVDQALRMTKHRDRFDLRPHGAVHPKDLPDLLLRYEPFIVHFSGHGTTLGDTAFQGDDGKQQLVEPQVFKALLTVLKDNIRCVVLNACYSQIQAEQIAESIDFVVGMNEAIANQPATNFSTGFYRGLGYGRTVQEAFDLGCIEIGLDGKGVVHRTRPAVSVGAPVGKHVLDGTAGIPQLVALRSDPAKVTLIDELGGNGNHIIVPPLHELKGPKLKAGMDALLAAYSTEAALELMVSTYLGENLNVIIGGSGLQDKVFRLLQWAQMRGRLTELFQAAVDDDPKNKKLTDFIATL